MASKPLKPQGELSGQRLGEPDMGLKKPKGEIIAAVSKGRQYESGRQGAPKR